MFDCMSVGMITHKHCLFKFKVILRERIVKFLVQIWLQSNNWLRDNCILHVLNVDLLLYIAILAHDLLLVQLSMSLLSQIGVLLSVTVSTL